MQPRREHTRIPIQLKVRIRHYDTAWETLSKDISAGGMLIAWHPQDRIALGSVVQVQVMGSAMSPTVPAKVVRITPDALALSFLPGDTTTNPGDLSCD